MTMRPPALRASFDMLPGELVVDHFAGGGGASEGIETAIGRPVDIAINHDAEAIAMHAANHPETRHYQQDIWEVDPREACGSRPVGLLWASPACTHFSRAKGGTNPLSAKIRSLAWVVVRWAKAVKPRLIFMENVEEFEDWGPLDENGRPKVDMTGRTFRQFIGRLSALGYQVSCKTLVAADYGAPTTRKRLFIQARCDGKPIVWPEATHGKGRAEAWQPAAKIIDWSLPCPSIFERDRPLAPATLRRIAAGVQRYVIDAQTPFIVPLTHQGGTRGCSVAEPMATVTAAHRGEFALISPTLIQTGYGERQGQAPRVPGLDKPLGTVVSGQKHALVAAFLAKHYGGVVGHGVQLPLGTVTAVDHHSLVSVSFVSKFYGTARTGTSLEAPLPTVTANGKGGGHLAEVRAFLLKYYGAEGRPQGQQLGLPLGTVTTRDRFGLVMIHGQPHQIVDIGMRMLAPHELFAAQGFPDDYQIAPTFNGKPLTKTAKIRLAGNSVCPPVAAAIVAANTRSAA